MSKPDLTRLKSLLRESKATSAAGRSLLNDPAGAQLIRDYQNVMDRAIAQGRLGLAEQAAQTLQSLQHLEREVARTGAQSEVWEDNAERVIKEVQDLSEE